MREFNQELANIQEISHTLAEMKGLTKVQRSQIAMMIKCAIENGVKIAKQENGQEILEEAIWNFGGF